MERKRSIGDSTVIITDTHENGNVTVGKYTGDLLKTYDNISVVTFEQFDFKTSPHVTRAVLSEKPNGKYMYKTIKGTGVAIVGFGNGHVDIKNNYGTIIRHVPISHVELPIFNYIVPKDSKCNEISFPNADCIGFKVLICGREVPIISSCKYKRFDKKKFNLVYKNRCIITSSVDDVSSLTEEYIMQSTLCMLKLTENLVLYAVKGVYWHVFDSRGYLYTTLTIEDFTGMTVKKIYDLRNRTNKYKVIHERGDITARTKEVLDIMTFHSNMWCVSRAKLPNGDWEYYKKFLPSNLLTTQKGDEISDYLSLVI